MIKEINGVSVCYSRSGQQGGKVLLLHGWGCDSGMMNPIEEALKGEHEVFSWTFPDTGRAEGRRNPGACRNTPSVCFIC